MAEQDQEPNDGQGQLDYSSMSDEQLEEMLNQQNRQVEIEARMPDLEPEPVEASPENGETVTELEQPAEETAPVEEPTDDEFDLQQSLMQEMELRASSDRAEIDRFKWMFGNSQNQVGELRKEVRNLQSVLQSLQGQPQSQGQYQEDFTQSPVPQRQPGPSMDPFYEQRLNQLEQGVRNRDVQAAYAEFMQTHRDVDDAVIAKMQPFMQEEVKAYQGLNFPPEQMGRLTRMVLDSALSKVRLAEIQSARAEALQRKADQVPKSRQAKEAAVISGSGSTPGAKPRQKDINEMTAEEADRELIKRLGDGHYRRSRSSLG